MTATELFQEGVNLMMVGMGFVLVFFITVNLGARINLHPNQSVFSRSCFQTT